MRCNLLLSLFFVFLFSVNIFGGPISSGAIDLFAVSEDGQGISAELKLTLVEGDGHVWSKISSLIGVSTQNTEKTVIYLAKNYVDYVDDYDYKYDIISDASIVDGPSAGLPMGLLTIGLLKGIEIPDYVSATGTISSKGEIGAIGGVLEKTKVAYEKGIKLFFVPESNLDVVVKDGNVKKVNLSNYAYEKYGIKVIGVRTLDDALNYVSKPLNEIIVSDKQTKEMIIYDPPDTNFKENLTGFSDFVNKYGVEVKENIEYAKVLMNNTLLDQDVTNTLLELTVYSEKLYNDGNSAELKKYLYSSANYYFLSNIYANIIIDVCEDPSLLTIDAKTFGEKMSVLKSNMGVLQKKIKQMPYDDFEWFVAAQERYLWASSYIEQIESVSVIVNNQVKNVAMEKLEKYEYAKEWVKIADGFLNNVKTTGFAVSVESYKESAYDTLQELAKSEGAISEYDLGSDLNRRIYGANMSYDNGWYLTSLYESATVLGIVNANLIISDKSYNELEQLVSEKILGLEKKMNDSNIMFVWSELYLSHAKYFLNESLFYKDQNNVIYATNSLSSSLELLYLADNLYSASNNFYSNRDNLKTDKIVVKDEEVITKANSKSNLFKELEWGFFNILLFIIILFALSFIGVYLFAKYKSKTENKIFSDINKEITQIKDYLLSLDKKYLSGKVLDDEYSILRKDYNKRLIYLEERRKKIVDNLEDLSYLESQQKYLQNKLSRAISFYTKGLISEEEYNRLVKDYKEEISNIRYNIEEDQKKLQKTETNIEKEQSPQKENKEEIKPKKTQVVEKMQVKGKPKQNSKLKKK